MPDIHYTCIYMECYLRGPECNWLSVEKKPETFLNKNIFLNKQYETTVLVIKNCADITSVIIRYVTKMFARHSTW